jgi:ferredoxin
MKARVNEAQCAGTGACEQICPKVFKVVGGTAKVQVARVPADQEDACREAAEACPTEAIKIEA